ncbi:Sel1 repeat-containing protein [Cohaesibacter marisflavi]|uniref:Sel1 repeat-containing protein n=1 Tax=Cohaesibacter marisflavi TaxID=655353 RepID=A0A1I5DAC4_9HYPH|nr:peptidoglycan-binding protein [Cohaesibacter marisflavi]SFN96067.1 Sel1 repeat-containing protein [Cohaesibacter marisflavi]
MIDDTYHTDRDVGEYIEGLRGTDRNRGAHDSLRATAPKGRPRQNSALLDAIEDIEAQLHALAGEAAQSPDMPFEREDTPQDYRASRTRRDTRGDFGSSPRRGRARGVPSTLDQANYGNALERIEAQLQRVDQALERKGGSQMARPRSSLRPERTPARSAYSTGTVSDHPVAREHMPSYQDRLSAQTGTTGPSVSLDSAMRQMFDRSQTLNEQVARKAEASVSQVTRTAQDALSAAQDSQGTYRDALDKLAKLQAQDDSLAMLRDDVTSLRKLIEEANLTGASDQVLREIASLSGRIEQLSTAISETREDPAILETMRDVRALLDRSAQDPSINAQFDRILAKLDDMDAGGHEEDFAKLSEQMDHLREILATQPDMQHLSSISGQINELIERLATLENDVKRANASDPNFAEQNGLEQRLSQMQALIERLDPNDRLINLENQLSALADRLENGSDHASIHKPLEALARQVESLVELTDQGTHRDQLDILATLAERVTNLDQFVRTEQAPAVSERRFEQVEQTLARIDDMLANKMESSDLGALERSLSRLADRMEAQEDILRSAPQTASATDGSALSSGAISQLERQIIDLAQRLDNASQVSDDHQFFEMLTERLDTLAAEFSRTQTRFDAVDRIGEDIRKLAANSSSGASGGANAAQVAEQAAIKALQQVGPIAGGGSDAALEAIIDGLKDDLHGLRRFAETSETSTQQSLNGVSSMLNAIVDRLGKLEEQVRAEELKPQQAALPDAPLEPIAEPASEEPKSRGLGNILRRRKAKSAPDAAEAAPQGQQGQPLSASELLQNRGRQPSRRQQSDASATSAPTRSRAGASVGPQQGMPAAASAGSSAPQVSSGESRQPGIYLSGKAVSVSKAQTDSATARQPGESAQAQPQVTGNVALKNAEQEAPAAKPRTARIVQGAPGSQAAQSSQSARSGSQRDQGQSKADFIAAARRAAQAAAQESAQVEKEQGAGGSFLSRFKGSKKPATEVEAQAPVTNEEDKAKGMSRKERRAAIKEAARMAKKMQKETANGSADAAAIEESAVHLLENEEASNSLFAKLGQTFSRHSRPLLMAAAAILLAITTIQLVKNPDSSLYGLFNTDTAQTQSDDSVPGFGDSGETVAPAGSSAPAQSTPDLPEAPVASEPASAGPQSSITPSSGSVAPSMSDEEATRAIAFSQPTLAQDKLAGPRVSKPAAQPLSHDAAMAKAKAMLNQPGNQGIDLTPTSSIPKDTKLGNYDALQEQAKSQPMPPVVSGGDDNQSSANLGSDSGTQEQTPIMQAATSGNVLAQFELGRRFTVGEGVEVDLKEAAKWFEKAANLNMPQAQYSLANLYEKGHGVKKDLQVARLWYQRAADQGNVKSMHNLAVLYAEGGLGKPDFKQAVQWFLKAADHGLKDSQYNLAILFARGMGVKQDLLQSYKWFAIAAKQGDKGAEAKRDEILSVLKGPQQKAAKALVAAWVPKVAKASVNQLSALPPEWVATTPEQLAKANKRLGADPRVIAKAQSMLGALGYNAGPADGQMGPRTRTAIRNFQEIAGLKVTGEIDAPLLEALAQRVI